ncbi:Arabinose efflux permease [Serratia proteamaculans]|uniref:hypothetical protein n=1 Tax=Serratia proteamaculans TaxID=28151 RepID=UPI00217840D1|nr:hypothetical protein [Serratia proteamaculans]CAI1560716.1 Arabinose efflux permease [Serratia proteamaculans]
MTEKYAPHAQGVAAALNIAGFNSGLALGSVLGGLTITHVSIVYTGISGAAVSLLGLLLVAPIRRGNSSTHNQAQSVGQ